MPYLFGHIASPVTWQTYFDSFEDIKVQGNTFRMYQSGNTLPGAVLVLLHGGGHSAMSWALTTVLRQKHFV